jgi:hypothetical protein
MLMKNIQKLIMVFMMIEVKMTLREQFEQVYGDTFLNKTPQHSIFSDYLEWLEAKVASDNSDYAKCKTCRSNGNEDGRCDMCCNNKPDMYDHFV